MSNVKKMLGVLMAAMLCFALTPIAAFADSGNVKDTKGEITITNAIPEQEYSVYEIFQLESYNNDAKAYSYKLVSNDWKPFFATGAEGANYVSVDGQGYVTWKDKADAAAFAKAAIKFAEDNNIKATATKKADKAPEGAETVKLQFTDLELGYYLVSSAVGTICSLDSTHNKVDITDKNEKPGVIKEVQEDSNESWGQSNNADIGQVVNFQSTITGQAGARNYVLHDKMTAGLTFNGEVAVTLNGAAVAASNYTLVTTPDDDCTFEVKFNKTFCDSIKANDQIIVSYSATLNKDAAISGDSNDNEVKLSYGNESNPVTTPPSTTKTYTGGINVFKHNAEGTGLAGAVFNLSLSDDGSNPITFVQLADGDERAEAGVPTYRPAVEGEEGSVDITTIESGHFKIVGLDADTYYLKETVAPDGYNMLADAKKVDVTEGAEGVVNFGDADVLNLTGLELPSTGGIGTTIFYIVGGILVVGAIAFLIVRRRANSTK